MSAVSFLGNAITWESWMSTKSTLMCLLHPWLLLHQIGMFRTTLNTKLRFGVKSNILHSPWISPVDHNLGCKSFEAFPVSSPRCWFLSTRRFSGIDSVKLCENGEWIESYERELGAYDAGTDDGVTFLSPDEPREERVPISRFDALDSSNIFYNPERCIDRFWVLPPTNNVWNLKGRFLSLIFAFRTVWYIASELLRALHSNICIFCECREMLYPLCKFKLILNE